MKLLIVSALAAMCAAAPPAGESSTVQITEYSNKLDGNGGYHFAYRTSDGTYREETGVLKNPGTDNEIMEVTGLTTWLAADGVEYTLSFLANENGFVATGEHLPKIAEVQRRPAPPRLGIMGSTLMSLLGR